MNPVAHSNSFKPRTAEYMAAFLTLPQVAPKSKSKPVSRRTLRTVMLVNGEIHGAKIDLATGEVRPHTYKDYFQPMRKARPNANAHGIEPFWMRMPAAVAKTGERPSVDKSRIRKKNGCMMYLQYLQNSASADDDLLALTLVQLVGKELPKLIEIIDNSNRYDMGGNTRGLSRTLLLSMLSTMDTITAGTVQRFMECSERHAQRVAVCLRVIVNAFMVHAEGKLSTGRFLTPPNISRASARQVYAGAGRELQMRKHGR